MGEPTRLPFGCFDAVDMSGWRRGQSLRVGVRPPSPPHESRTSAHPPPQPWPFLTSLRLNKHS